MKSNKSKSSMVIDDGAELSLSGADIAVLAQAVLQKGANFRIKAKGCSMLPLIKNGDILTLMPTTRIKPVLGDIAAFIRPDSVSMAVHRIVGKSEDGMLIKGDFNFENDGIVPGDKIIGIVKYVERNGKPVKFGLGIEKKMIALMVKMGVFPVVFNYLMKISKPKNR